MLLHVLNEEHVRLELDASDAFEVHGTPFSSFQMLATSLALCTASVLDDYAATAQLHLHGLAIDVEWDFVERPHRVGEFRMAIEIGPEIPPTRHKALLRAAEQCPVHNTLMHATPVKTRLEVNGAKQA